MQVHILTEPLVTQNTRAFMMPILQNERRLRARGIRVKCFYEVSHSLCECDVLALNNRWWGNHWPSQRQRALDLIAGFAERVPLVLYFDRSSTPGSFEPEVMPHVARYYKTILFKDRSLYLKSLYCSRLFSDYYHKNFGVEDAESIYSSPLLDSSHLDKLRLSWNAALADYSLIGPRLSSWYRHLPLKTWFKLPTRFHPPSASRPIDLSCRMGLTHKHETVAYQRKTMAKLLSTYRRTDKVSKTVYFRELKNSKIVASPFGFSEINYKDFEVFICGALLLKPDLSHLETYPDLFKDGETFVSHSWELDDVVDKINEILARYGRYLDIAQAGQELYKKHVSTSEGQELFVDRFERLLDTAPAGSERVLS